MTPIRRTAAALAAAALLLAGPVPAATADTFSHADERGDVVAFTMDPETEEQTATPAPEATDGDVTRTVVRHGARKVVLTLRFAELRRSRVLRIETARIRTDEGLRRDVMVAAGDGMHRGQVQLSRPSGRQVRCDGLGHRIDYDRDAVHVSVPRTCLGQPRWVKAAVFSMRAPDGDQLFADDALQGAVTAESPLAWTPRLRRG